MLAANTPDLLPAYRAMALATLDELHRLAPSDERHALRPALDSARAVPQSFAREQPPRLAAPHSAAVSFGHALSARVERPAAAGGADDRGPVAEARGGRQEQDGRANRPHRDQPRD